MACLQGARTRIDASAHRSRRVPTAKLSRIHDSKGIWTTMKTSQINLPFGSPEIRSFSASLLLGVSQRIQPSSSFIETDLISGLYGAQNWVNEALKATFFTKELREKLNKSGKLSMDISQGSA
ncbi:MAG: hypothetical protein ABIJ84_04335 [bacterium]